MRGCDVHKVAATFQAGRPRSTPQSATILEYATLKVDNNVGTSCYRAMLNPLLGDSSAYVALKGGSFSLKPHWYHGKQPQAHHGWIWGRSCGRCLALLLLNFEPLRLYITLLLAGVFVAVLLTIEHQYFWFIPFRINFHETSNPQIAGIFFPKDVALW